MFLFRLGGSTVEHLGGKDTKSRDWERRLGGTPGWDSKLMMERVFLGRAQHRVTLWPTVLHEGSSILPGLAS